MAKNIGATLSLKNGNFFTNLNSASKGIKAFKNNLNAGTGALKKHSTQAKSTGSALSSLKGKLTGVIGAYASLSGIKALGTLSDEMTSTKARLDMVNDGLQTNAELQKMIFKSAKDSRGQYKSTADLVIKLGNNCGTVFKTTKETVEFAEQLNKRFVLAGASSAESNSAITQLAQGLAAGALRGEELNSVLENAPNIARAIESYMGIAQGSIKQAAEKGLVTADVVKNAILSTADETNAKFKQMPLTWGQIWQNIKTTALQSSDSVLSAINKIANGDKFSGVVQKITNSIENLANSGAVETFANKLISATDKAISGIQFLYNNWSKFKPLIIGIVAVMGTYKAAVLACNVAEGVHKVLLASTSAILGINQAKLAGCTTAQLAHASALGIAELASNGLAVATKLLNAAFVSTPIGWIALAVGGIVLLWTKCEGFRKFFTNLGSSMEKAFNKFVDSSTKKVKSMFAKFKSIFKLPKIVQTGTISLGGVDLFPKYSLQWYAKGGIMRRPTMFGINGNHPMIGGEAGAEAILPLSQFWTNLRRYMSESPQRGKSVVNQYITINVEGGSDEDTVARNIAKKVSAALKNM